MRDFVEMVVLPVTFLMTCVAFIIGGLLGVALYHDYCSAVTRAAYLKSHHNHNVTWQEASVINVYFDAASGKVEVSQ